jgi:hypothetical protein
MRRSFHRLSHAVYSHAVYAKALSLSKGDWLPKLALLSIRIPAGQRSLARDTLRSLHMYEKAKRAPHQSSHWGS